MAAKCFQIDMEDPTISIILESNNFEYLKLRTIEALKANDFALSAKLMTIIMASIAETDQLSKVKQQKLMEALNQIGNDLADKQKTENPIKVPKGSPEKPLTDPQVAKLVVDSLNQLGLKSESAEAMLTEDPKSRDIRLENSPQ